MIVTVTMNGALNRILTVPNFQRGHRHRASEKLTLAGGKGIIVARGSSGSASPSSRPGSSAAATAGASSRS